MVGEKPLWLMSNQDNAIGVKIAAFTECRSTDRTKFVGEIGLSPFLFALGPLGIAEPKAQTKRAREVLGPLEPYLPHRVGRRTWRDRDTTALATTIDRGIGTQPPRPDPGFSR